MSWSLLTTVELEGHNAFLIDLMLLFQRQNSGSVIDDHAPLPENTHPLEFPDIGWYKCSPS